MEWNYASSMVTSTSTPGSMLIDVYIHEHARYQRFNSIQRDSYNLFDNVCGAAEVDEALVNTHLEAVPGVGSLTTG